MAFDIEEADCGAGLVQLVTHTLHILLTCASTYERCHVYDGYAREGDNMPGCLWGYGAAYQACQHELARPVQVPRQDRSQGVAEEPVH